MSDTTEGVVKNLEDMLTWFEANNVTLAPKKFHYGQEVNFVGMSITKDGCAADPDCVEAVEQFPRPETRSQVRQLLGLCQQFSQWVPDKAPKTVNMRSLLRRREGGDLSQKEEVHGH